VIAYIPREKNFYSPTEYKQFLPQVKTFRLQQLYQAALTSLIQAQKGDGLTGIKLKLGNESKIVNLKIPVMFIIGDNQGGDTITGRTIHYGKSARRISRTCDATCEHLANPTVDSCNRIIMNDVKKLVIEQKWDKLYDLYQAQHWISWFDVDYGGNPEGIFSAACPPEALHALENGIFQHVLNEFFNQVLKSKTRAGVDRLVSSYNEYPGQHYLRSHHIDGYPRLLYTSGISKMSDLKADDKVGIIFCVVIAALQTEGRNLFMSQSNISDSQYRDILYVFELMLCYGAWLKHDTYWKYNDTLQMYNVQKAIEKLLRQIIHLMPRTTGNNWEIAKMHEQLHVAENIYLFGAHRNVHTGPQEHNHIENTKKPSHQVQRKKLNWIGN
jgi:hypothetical protein